jgi:hypothetical protein
MDFGRDWESLEPHFYTRCARSKGTGLPAFLAERSGVDLMEIDLSLPNAALIHIHIRNATLSFLVFLLDLYNYSGISLLFSYIRRCIPPSLLSPLKLVLYPPPLTPKGPSN